MHLREKMSQEATARKAHTHMGREVGGDDSVTWEHAKLGVEYESGPQHAQRWGGMASIQQ